MRKGSSATTYYVFDYNENALCLLIIRKCVVSFSIAGAASEQGSILIISGGSSSKNFI